MIGKRKEAIFESGLLFGGNKINISDYAPKPVVIAESKFKTKGRLRRLASASELPPDELNGSFVELPEVDVPVIDLEIVEADLMKKLELQ